MKKVTHLIIGLSLVTAPINAQTGLSILPRAGLNMASISPVTASIVKPGINFGASMEYMFTPRIGMELGLIYSMQGVNFAPNKLYPITSGMDGAEISVQEELQKGVNNTSHDYLNIPVLAKIYFGKNYGTTKGFHLIAGGQVDIKALVDKVGYTNGYEGELLPGDTNSPLGFSLVLGAGYLLDSGLSFSTGVNWGMTNAAQFQYARGEDGAYIRGDGGKHVQENVNKVYRNIVFQLNFAYRFSLSKNKTQQQGVDATIELF